MFGDYYQKRVLDVVVEKIFLKIYLDFLCQYIIVSINSPKPHKSSYDVQMASQLVNIRQPRQSILDNGTVEWLRLRGYKIRRRCISKPYILSCILVYCQKGFIALQGRNYSVRNLWKEIGRNNSAGVSIKWLGMPSYFSVRSIHLVSLLHIDSIFFISVVKYCFHVVRQYEVYWIMQKGFEWIWGKSVRDNNMAPEHEYGFPKPFFENL